jgi:signal peptidase II
VLAMQTNLRQRIKQSLIFLAAALIILILDQLSKQWVLKNLAPVFPDGVPSAMSLKTIPVVPSILQFQYAENTGAAFSLFQDHPAILSIIASLLALGVFVWGFTLPLTERMNRVALGMIFGGAIGNLIDRFLHSFVVDFIMIHWKGRPLWPTFNIADSAICVGIGLFFIFSWVTGRKAAQKVAEVK